MIDRRAFQARLPSPISSFSPSLPPSLHTLQIIKLGQLRGDLLPSEILQDALTIRRVLRPQHLGMSGAGGGGGGRGGGRGGGGGLAIAGP